MKMKKTSLIILTAVLAIITTLFLTSFQSEGEGSLVIIQFDNYKAHISYPNGELKEVEIGQLTIANDEKKKEAFKNLNETVTAFLNQGYELSATNSNGAQQTLYLTK